MKLTSKILIALLLLLIAELMSSNSILKKQYDKMDKSDLYWTYEKVLQQPFKHLKITGGNGTNIAFEQSATPSVRILQEWKRYHNGGIKAHITNDTLYINFDFAPANLYEKFWMQHITAVRIFSPQLLSVEGYNTNFEMFKLKQKSIKVSMAGKSQFEVESMLPAMDSLTITQKDSAAVVFEMSPEYKKAPVSADEQRAMVIKNNMDGGVITFTPASTISSAEAMSINSVKADLQGYTILDLGHAQIQALQLHIADSSAIILSGGALRKTNQ